MQYYHSKKEYNEYLAHTTLKDIEYKTHNIYNPKVQSPDDIKF